MNVCVAGKNNIAVDVSRYILKFYPEAKLFAIPNRNDDGKDGWQQSFLKFAIEHPNVLLADLEQLYRLTDLLFLSTEFDRIIDPSLFSSSKLYNIHFSLLPAYKGVYTSAIPILYGEPYAGVTLHCIDSGIDTGDIIDQKKIRITKQETSYSLYNKFIEQGTLLVTKNIERLIKGRYVAKPQPSEGSSYFSRKSINYSNLMINLNSTASQIDRQIRAFYFPVFQIPIVYSYPITHTVILKNRSKLKPGEIVKDVGNFIVLSTIDYDIRLYKKT